MPKIYIANSSRQNWMFNFRHKDVPAFSVDVPSGQQREISHVPAEHLEKVINGLRQYGAVTRTELSGHTEKFEGLIYSTDKPLQEAQFHYGHDEVMDQAETRAVIEASKAAMASDLILNPRNRDRATGITEVEFEEESAMRGQKKKSMKITVDPALSRGDKVALQ